MLCLAVCMAVGLVVGFKPPSDNRAVCLAVGLASMAVGWLLATMG